MRSDIGGGAIFLLTCILRWAHKPRTSRLPPWYPERHWSLSFGNLQPLGIHWTPMVIFSDLGFDNDSTLSKMYSLPTVLPPALNFMFQEGKQTRARGLVDPLLLGARQCMDWCRDRMWLWHQEIDRDRTATVGSSISNREKTAPTGLSLLST